jgi:hypothetical protein
MIQTKENEIIQQSLKVSIVNICGECLTNKKYFIVDRQETVSLKFTKQDQFDQAFE